VKASSELKLHGDLAGKPYRQAMVFSEPYLSIVHALRLAKADSRQMDALVTLKGQVGAGSSKHGKDEATAQGHLNAFAAVLGAAPVCFASAPIAFRQQATLLLYACRLLTGFML
jgi:hypothetical protein